MAYERRYSLCHVRLATYVSIYIDLYMEMLNRDFVIKNLQTNKKTMFIEIDETTFWVYNYNRWITIHRVSSRYTKEKVLEDCYEHF